MRNSTSPPMKEVNAALDEVYAEITNLTSILTGISQFNRIMGSQTKLAIIFIILAFPKPLNKTMIHAALQWVGIDISYKNTLWNLDQLKKDKLISFERVKEENNSTYIRVNKKLAKEKIDQILHTLIELDKRF